jgi:hypothetical protein
MATDFDSCVSEGGKVIKLTGPFTGRGLRLNAGESVRICQLPGTSFGTGNSIDTFEEEPELLNRYVAEIDLTLLTPGQIASLKTALQTNHAAGVIGYTENIAGTRARVKVGEISGKGDTLSRIEGQPWLVGVWQQTSKDALDTEETPEGTQPKQRRVPESKEEEWRGPLWEEPEEIEEPIRGR